MPRSPALQWNIDEYVVMPNHIHGIIHIVHDDGVGHGAVPLGDLGSGTVERFGKPVSGSIPTIVRAFKAATTRRINELRRTQGAPVWQRNYHEHLIRDDASLQQIREYILQNPASWPDDPENQS